MKRVLIICGHNSARSQMAEEYLRLLGGENFSVESAGLEPRPINPNVLTVMKEEGIDLSHKRPQDVFDLYKGGRHYDYVISVCSIEEENCPIFPRVAYHLHLPLPDPNHLEGTKEEILDRTRQIRDAIKGHMSEFITWVGENEAKPLPPDWKVV
jgi:arsenate reductase